MLGHMLDHFIFSARRLSQRTKAIAFGICATAIFGTFWWFKGMAFGMEGPIDKHWGLGWRKVSHFVRAFSPCHGVECYVFQSWNIYNH